MNILIVKTSAIGDVTHTLPALNAIREKYPEAHIAWLVEQAAADIVIGHKALDRVLVSKRKQWAKQLFSPDCKSAIKEIYLFLKQLRDTRYDLVIDFQNLLKSGVLIGLTHGLRKAGYGKGMEHSEFSYIFLNQKIPAVSMDIHAVSRELMLIESLGISSNEIKFKIPIDDSHTSFIDELLKKNNIDPERLLIAVHPEAKWETKLWDNIKFAETADKIIGRYDAQVVFTGSPDEISTVDNIQTEMKQKAVNLAGKTDLKTLCALYQKARLLVTTDTGPMHLAAAVKTPVTAIFGPTAPWRTGPFGNGHQVIRAGLSCSPCLKRQCDTRKCMSKISVDDVMKGVANILEKNINITYS